jgi:TonB family protein
MITGTGRHSAAWWTAVLLAVGCLLTADSRAQTGAKAPGQPMLESGRRLALVIGNEAYPNQGLKNPGNDARAMLAALQEAGFQVDIATDTSFRDMNAAIDRFVAKIQPSDVALFYYSGHGIEIEGENYLLPVDFVARDEADARYVSYSASRLLDRMTATNARMKVLILDACRSNPFRVSRDGRSGLAAMASSGRGSLIAFAAGPGSTADDNIAGSNGLFTMELLKAMREAGLGIEQVFSRVRSAVDEVSGGRQTPWTNSSLIGEFYFHPPLLRPTSTSAPLTTVGPLPSSALAILRGSDLAKTFHWANGSIDLKIPGADVAARQEVEQSLKQLLARLGAIVTFFEASGIYWSEPTIDLTTYVSAESWRTAGVPPGRPPADLSPIVKLGYVDLQRLADSSNLGKALRAQVVAGGSTPAQQQAAQETFERAVSVLLEPISRARGVQMLFSSNQGAIGFADEKLNLTADFNMALDDPGFLARQNSGAVPSAVGSRVRYINLQDIVSRSRLGRDFTAQVQQAVARNASQDEIARLSAKLQDDFQKILAPVVERNAKAAGLRIVLTPAESGLIWSEKTFDFTDVVVRDLDATVPTAPATLSAPVKVGGTIKEPTKIKDVLPDYPSIAQSARVSGNVVIEATISPQGFVTDARAMTSPSLLLEIPALAAVRQWQYTPTFVNGVAVPVIMTVTVTFSLK